MTFIFDECTSPRVVECLREMEFRDVKHLFDFVDPGCPDAEFLPGIGMRGDVLVSADPKMLSNTGKHGHRAILLEFEVKVLILPSVYRNVKANQQLIWISSNWAKVMKSWADQPNLTIGKIQSNGTIEPVSF